MRLLVANYQLPIINYQFHFFFSSSHFTVTQWMVLFALITKLDPRLGGTHGFGKGIGHRSGLCLPGANGAVG